MPRAQAFSGKKKKEQLKEKKRRKHGEKVNEEGNESREKEEVEENEENEENKENKEEKVEKIEKIEKDKHLKKHSKEDKEEKDEEANGETENKLKGILKIPFGKTNFSSKLRDLKTVFEKESTEEIQTRLNASTEPLNIEKRSKPWTILKEVTTNVVIDIPKRPVDISTLTQEEIDKVEEEMFENWIKNIYEKYSKERLNYFEHNLEVWRQLWRVCEKSHILLLITDARFPLFHFPPALYNYVVNEQKKPLYLIMNKKDLVEERVLLAWKEYFRRHFPKLHVIFFNAFTGIPPEYRALSQKKRKLLKRRYESAEGISELVENIKTHLTETQLTSINEELETRRKDLLSTEPKNKKSNEEDANLSDDPPEEEIETSSQNSSPLDIFNATILGFVGHPNVGKSSMINGLVGKKVVSTSRTPGHTKRFQTIFLTKDLVLCDCPGLVFPALDRPKSLQILCGLYPIAQVREPYSPLRYLAERLPIEKMYGLQLPEDDESWTPYNICEAYAQKRGYFIAKTGRLDTHRAGLELLYDCIDGKIAISWPPPDILDYADEIEKVVQALPKSQGSKLPKKKKQHYTSHRKHQDLLPIKSSSSEEEEEEEEEETKETPKQENSSEEEEEENPQDRKKQKKKQKKLQKKLQKKPIYLSEDDE